MERKQCVLVVTERQQSFIFVTELRVIYNSPKALSKTVNQSRYRPGVAQRVPEIKVPVFVTTAQDGGRLSALRTGRLYLQEMFLLLIFVRG